VALGFKVAFQRSVYRAAGVVQPHYNLVQRGGYERDIAPVVADEGLAVTPGHGPAAAAEALRALPLG
jgi:aryl-alcohol dehydrogenase-like predicted oxidoreductase